MTEITPTGKGWYQVPGVGKVRGKDAAEAALSRSSPAKADLRLALLSRLAFAQRAGFQYGSKRDIYEVAGYIAQGQEEFDDYWGFYDRNEIAGRIVDMAPKGTWKTPPEIVEPDVDPEKPTPFMADFSALAERLRLWHYFERADRLSRIGRYGVLFIGVPGEDMALKEEMPTLRGPDDVLYLSAFSEKAAAIKSFVRDTGDPRFGLPLMYELDFSTATDTTSTSRKMMVHHSRVIHIAEDLLDDEVYGRPVLKRLLNRLSDLEKVTASTGESYWQMAARILTGEIDPDAAVSETTLDNLGGALEEMVHDLRRQFISEGVKLSWLDSTPADPGSAADLFMTLIAAGAGIPKRILFGSETGERASTEDQKTWYSSINERQEQHAEPSILRAFIDRLGAYNAMDLPKAGYDVVWPTLFEEPESLIADANLKRAETAKALTPVGGDPMELVEVDEERNVWIRSTPPEGFVRPQPEEDDLGEGEDDDTVEGPDVTPMEPAA